MQRDSGEFVIGPSLAGALSNATTVLAASATALYGVSVDASEIELESPRRSEFGDRATNFAFSLAKTARRSPQQIATELVDDAIGREPLLREQFSAISADGGFINLRFAPTVWQHELLGLASGVHGFRACEPSPDVRRVSL